MFHAHLCSPVWSRECSPQGLDSAADLPKITQALYERGYTAADLDKILGGNLMRVFSEVEKLSKEIQAEPNRDTRPEIKPSTQPQS